jgi:pimeloyl-ACP methyl ester carboxylesterase
MKKQASIWLTLFLCLAGTNQTSAQHHRKGVVPANGIRIAYEIFGDENDDAILLIQGTGVQLTGWPEALCKRLADDGYQVIRFDNRDAGLSTSLDSLGMPDWGSVIPLIGDCDMSKLPYTLNAMAADAVGLLNALNIEKANIVGASMGGAIAQLVAINFPDKVLSLTSIMASSGNPALPQGDTEVLKTMGTPPPQTEDTEVLAQYLFTIYRALASPGYPTPDSLMMQMARSNIERSWNPTGTARQAAAVIIGDNCDRRENLKKLSVPVVIIHGEADPVVKVEAAHELAATIPGAKLITIPGMGHDLPDALIPKVCRGILMAAGEN